MLFVTLGRVTQKEIQDKVRDRYRAETSALQELGFEELCFYSEIRPRYSLFFFLLRFLWLRFKREVVQIGPAWSVMVYYPLLIHRDDMTCAQISGSGVRFYTAFVDGTELLSANYGVSRLISVDKMFYQHAADRSIEGAWKFHQAEIIELRLDGLETRDAFGFEDYVRMRAHAEERNTQGPGCEVVVITLAILNVFEADYEHALAYMLGGMYFVLDSSLGHRIKNETLRQVLVYLSGSVLLFGVVIWIIALLLNTLVG